MGKKCSKTQSDEDRKEFVEEGLDNDVVGTTTTTEESTTGVVGSYALVTMTTEADGATGEQKQDEGDKGEP